MATNEYKDIFAEEAREQVDILNDRLLQIEKDPNNVQVIHDIFRVAHTLKSSAAFVGLEELSDFCHKMETLLQKVRDKEITLDGVLVDTFFQSLDKIRDGIELYIDKDEILKDYTTLSQKLDGYISGQRTTASPEVSQNTVAESAEDKSAEDESKKSEENTHSDIFENLSDNVWDKLNEAEEKKDTLVYINVVFEKDVKMKWVRAELVYVNVERMGSIIACNPEPEEFKTEKLGESIEVILAVQDLDIEKIEKQLDIDLVDRIEVRVMEYPELRSYKTDQGAKESETKVESSPDTKQEPIPQVAMETAKAEPKPEPKVEPISESQVQNSEPVKAPAASPDTKTVQDKDTMDEVEIKSVLSKSETVRVPIKKLDELLNLVGELAIVNSGFVVVYEDIREMLGSKEIVTEFEGKIDQLANIAKSLQEGIMQSRMVPIGTVFSRFSRLIRDLSKNLDKKVDVVFKGEETELDKKIIDVIGDPLIHLIRNSIDHGIESVDERKKSGKSETGKIILNAYQSGNHIFVEVSDDGKGLNRDKIIRKAVEKQLISEDEVQSIQDNEVFQMVFLPGFSTKDDISSISGRGVGMDVVLQTVKGLNGSVSVRSKQGQGSTFTLSFPLTLAIVPAILVDCGEETYAIPLSNVVETIKVETEEVKTVDFHEVIQLRSQVIPLLRLNDIFEVDSNGEDGRLSIVISDFEGQQIGIVVDKLLGKREIVIKTLSQNYREVKGLTGATILGNGKIALILDVPGLIEQSRKIGRVIKTRLHTQQLKGRNGMNSHQSKIMDLKIDENELDIQNQVLKEFELDVESFRLVKEIFKTALATSANNIKHFLNKDVALAIPEIEVHSFEKVRNLSRFTKEEKMYFADINLEEELHGKISIALDEVGMKLLFKDLIGNQPLDSQVGQACINEICNLLAAGITNTISRALKIRAYPSAPRFHHETYKQYFTELFAEHHKQKNNYIWMIDTDIVIDTKVVKGKVYIFPYDSSFKKVSHVVRDKKEMFSFMSGN